METKECICQHSQICNGKSKSSKKVEDCQWQGICGVGWCEVHQA